MEGVIKSQVSLGSCKDCWNRQINGLELQYRHNIIVFIIICGWMQHEFFTNINSPSPHLSLNQQSLFQAASSRQSQRGCGRHVGFQLGCICLGRHKSLLLSSAWVTNPLRMISCGRKQRSTWGLFPFHLSIPPAARACQMVSSSSAFGPAWLNEAMRNDPYILPP